MAPKLKLTYFPLPGRAEKVRLAFVLGGVEFEDVRVPPADWPALKPNTPYGQVPILEIDGAVMGQSEAMLRYAGQLTPSLYPEGKRLEIDELLGLIADCDRAWIPAILVTMRPAQLGYPADFAGSEEQAARAKEMRDKFLANDLPRFCGYFSARLEKTGAFLTGDSPTIADCAVVTELRKFTFGNIEHIPADCLDQFPVITAFIDRFLALPAVKAYYEKK